MYLSRYIHLNPMELLIKNQQLQSYPWSSYPSYVGNLKTKWLNKEFILSSFIKNQNNLFNSYKEFVEDYTKKMEENNKTYKDLFLD